MVVSGLMPNTPQPISASTTVPMPIERPPTKPPPPPLSRRSSTLSDSRLPSHLMNHLRCASRASGAWPQRTGSGLGQGHAMLALVLALAVLVAHGAFLVALEEQHLGAALAGVDLGRQWRGVGELQRHVALPLGLERRDVDDDAAARIGALAQADGEHVARDAEILHSARQREAVGRDDAVVALEVDEALLVEVLRVHHGAVDVGEDLEFARAANVVAVAAGAVADDLAAVTLADLAGLEGLDHAVLLGHAADPFVALDAHG